jgi:hypothetical protein
MRIIAESGALYTIMAMITFIVEIVGSNALYITTDMVCHTKLSVAIHGFLLTLS